MRWPLESDQNLFFDIVWVGPRTGLPGHGYDTYFVAIIVSYG